MPRNFPPRPGNNNFDETLFVKSKELGNCPVGRPASALPFPARFGYRSRRVYPGRRERKAKVYIHLVQLRAAQPRRRRIYIYRCVVVTAGRALIWRNNTTSWRLWPAGGVGWLVGPYTTRQFSMQITENCDKPRPAAPPRAPSGL